MEKVNKIWRVYFRDGSYTPFATKEEMELSVNAWLKMGIWLYWEEATL